MRAEVKAGTYRASPVCLLEWLLKPDPTPDEGKEREAARLEAKRKNPCGNIRNTSGEIQRSWTALRRGLGAEAGRERPRSQIRELEARRKVHAEEMLKRQSEMKNPGFEAPAGAVDVS